MRKPKREMPPTTWVRSVAFPPPDPRPKHINHFGLSGGKDSTALALWAIHESGYPRETLDFSFCDTGNESQITLDYVRYLEQALRVGITWIKPGLDFFALARWKKRFPGAKSRFCTQFLKINPTVDYINAGFREGHTMTLHSGVRAAESSARAKLLEREYDGRFLCEVVRPLHGLKISDVWRMHEKYGVKPNPLYALGMKRVGCFPCMMSRKDEIRRISDVFPEAIDNIRVKEKSFDEGRGSGGVSTFFASEVVPPRFRGTDYQGKDGRRHKIATIDDVVRWSRTGKGAKHPLLQYEIDQALLPMDVLNMEQLPSELDAGQCPSTLGACE